MPCASDAAILAAHIARLAQVTGTFAFRPHITLRSDEPAPTEAFAVALVALEHSDERFRCVTLRAERTGPLVAVEAPHLSLVYGELPPAERAAIVDSIDLPLPMTITIDAVELVDTTGPASTWHTLHQSKLM